MKQELLYKPKNGLLEITKEDKKHIEEYCSTYKKFLDAGKTERECVREEMCIRDSFNSHDDVS